MREFFDLPNNPLFVKHLRSRLRKPAVIPGVLVVAFLCLCVALIDIQIRSHNPNSIGGSYAFFLGQGFILLLMGGSQVASSVSQMKSSGIIDFHRITPVPPSVQTVGLLLGAPIRELLLYAVTLPFGLYVAMNNSIGAGNYGKVVLAQLAAAVMWYSFALVVGLTASKARGASGQYGAIMIGLNFAASGLFTGGVYGPTLVTLAPIYREVFVEEDLRLAQQRHAQQEFGGPRRPGRPPMEHPELQRPPVTFYGFSMPIVAQSLMFQASMLIFMFIAAARRLHSSRMPLYTKPVALLFLTTLAALTLGSLWDSPTIFLTLGAAYFLIVCAMLLILTITPPLGEVVKGMQRARKLSSLHVPIWSDLASNKFAVAVLALIVLASIGLGLLAAPQPPAPNASAFSPWPSLAVAILAIFTFGLGRQYFMLAFGGWGRMYFLFFLFIVWVAPFLIGLIVAMTETKQAAYVLAASPIVGIAFAGLTEMPLVNATVIQAIAIALGAIFSVAFLVLLINEERKLLRDVAEEHRVGPGGEEPEPATVRGEA